MDKLLSILLVEDEPAECDAIIQCVDSSEDFRSVGAVNSVVEALRHTKDNLPDVIILDLELHKGSGNGITFLSELSKIDMPLTPYILVTTNNVSKTTHDMVRQAGADFIMVKSQKDYCAESVIEFLRATKSQIREHNHKNEAIADTGIVSPAELKSRLQRRVIAELNLIGISPKSDGYDYLVAAIMHVMDGKTDHISYTAHKYDKSIASVERAMQRAIDSAWIHGDTETLFKYYTAIIRSSNGSPTLKEFVKYYAYRIMEEYHTGGLT